MELTLKAPCMAWLNVLNVAGSTKNEGTNVTALTPESSGCCVN